MPETTNIAFSYTEVVTALIKTSNLHEGIWGLFVRFGLSATNVGESETVIRPAAIIPVLEIGLQKFEKEGNLSVDAAKVNPQMDLIPTLLAPNDKPR
jgi:hypothetical protein